MFCIQFGRYAAAGAPAGGSNELNRSGRAAEGVGRSRPLVCSDGDFIGGILLAAIILGGELLYQRAFNITTSSSAVLRKLNLAFICPEYYTKSFKTWILLRRIVRAFEKQWIQNVLVGSTRTDSFHAKMPTIAIIKIKKHFLAIDRKDFF